MTKLLNLLVLHGALSALASTCFTVVTSVGHGRFQSEYFRCCSRSDWGVPYQFTDSLPVVLTYLAAYCVAYRGGSQIIVLSSILLCAVGFASFTFELSHWFVDHNRSLIASAPIALLALAAVAAIQQYRRRTAGPTNDDEHTLATASATLNHPVSLKTGT